MEREAELLCLLNLALIDGTAERRIDELRASGIDWVEFFELVELNAVTVLTVRRMKERGMAIPAALSEKAEALTLRGEKRAEWALKFLGVMQAKGIDVVLLKGGLLSSTIYRSRCYKKMNDIDVLVRWEQAHEAAATLKDLGFASVGALFGEKEISAGSHHAPPYVSPDLGCVVGLHWGLHSKLAPWKSDVAGIWSRVARIDADSRASGVQALRMSWEENLLHLCIHLPFYKIGLRELADVYNLVLYCRPEIDWSLFEDLVDEWRGHDAVYRVLRLAQALSPRPLGIPSGLLERCRLKTSALCRWDTERRIRVPGVLIRSRSVHIAKIEKAFSIFRITGRYSEKVKAWAATWAFTMAPKRSELLKLTGRVRFNSVWDELRARLVAPFLVWSAMARDYGQLPLTLITLINIGIVFRETVKRPFARSGQSIFNHPARRLLEVLE